jgi:hypothetical protein
MVATECHHAKMNVQFYITVKVVATNRMSSLIPEWYQIHDPRGVVAEQFVPEVFWITPPTSICLRRRNLQYRMKYFQGVSDLRLTRN